MIIQENLQFIKEKNGLTYKQFSEITKISIASLNKIQRGIYFNLGIINIVKLTESFKVSIFELLFENFVEKDICTVYNTNVDQLNFLKENLIFLRKLQGMTLKDLSEKSSVSIGMINRIENGKCHNPGIISLLHLSNSLMIPIDNFIFDDLSETLTLIDPSIY